VKIPLYAKNNATNAMVINIGLYGSSATRLLIQAPLIPTISRANGTRQQREAAILANTPLVKLVLTFVDIELT
jgi:hypothetical protein